MAVQLVHKTTNLSQLLALQTDLGISTKLSEEDFRKEYTSHFLLKSVADSF